MLKLYIAVHEGAPDYMVPTLVAHSVLNAHIKFEDDDLYHRWLNGSFKKVVLKVNAKEFMKISDLPSIHLGHENTIMDKEPSCIVVCPREEIPNVLKFAKMWKPNEAS